MLYKLPASSLLWHHLEALPAALEAVGGPSPGLPPSAIPERRGARDAEMATTDRAPRTVLVPATRAADGRRHRRAFCRHQRRLALPAPPRPPLSAARPGVRARGTRRQRGTDSRVRWKTQKVRPLSACACLTLAAPVGHDWLPTFDTTWPLMTGRADDVD